MEQLTMDFEQQDTGDPGAQCKMILRALRRGEKLTPLDMLARFGVYRASGRIFDLRREGHPIKTVIVKVPSGKRVAQYSL